MSKIKSKTKKQWGYLITNSKVIAKDVLEKFPAKLANDKGFILSLVAKNGLNLAVASDTLKDDVELVSVAVKQEPYALGYASERIKGDINIVSGAINKDAWLLCYANQELKNNKDFVLQAVNQKGIALEWASENLRSDSDVVRKATNQNVLSFKFVGKDFDDIELALSLFQNNGHLFKYAPEKIRMNDNLAYVAINSYPGAIEWASDKLKGDKNLALSLVQKDGMLLKHLPKFEDDGVVVYEAVKQNRDSIKYACDEILKLCENTHAHVLEVLESYILVEQLNKELSQKQDVKPTRKMKI